MEEGVRQTMTNLPDPSVDQATPADSKRSPQSPSAEQSSQQKPPVFRSISQWFRFERIGVALLLLLALDAIWRIHRNQAPFREFHSRRADDDRIWTILNSWREHPPQGYSPKEWDIRLIELGLWALGDGPTYYTMVGPYPLHPNTRREFLGRLESVNREPVTEKQLDELFEYLVTNTLNTATRSGKMASDFDTLRQELRFHEESHRQFRGKRR